MAAENRESSFFRYLSLISLLSNVRTNSKSELSTCCNNVRSYKIGRVNKGSILVLILSYLVSSILHLLATIGVNYRPYQAWVIPFGITTAVAGWLTDAFIGRYKMIRCSVWIMWLLTITATVSAVVGQLDETCYRYIKIINSVLLCLLSIGLGGFQANIVQLGLDQLHDASTTEIKSFITWYVSTLIGAGFIVEFNFYCLSEQRKIFILLFTCLTLSLALIVLICCNHWLIKEPATQSPFKLIYKVIKFASVTKHPRCRSAFTYCEDELPSRIDFGKSKYGGPFTTEQVEDVKTFLRLLPLIAFIGAALSALTASSYLFIYLEKQYNLFKGSNLNSQLESRKVLTECYTETSMTSTVYLGVTLLIILHEFLLYPLFHRCICHAGIKSIWKLTMGIALQLLRIIALIVLNIHSRRSILNNSRLNLSTIECAFHYAHGQLSETHSDQWLAILQYLHFISLTLILIGTFEFICSQVPYSMKGVIIGAQYTLILIGLIPILAMVLFFKLDFSIWGEGIISCEFWYALVVLVANLVIFLASMCLAKRYKMRKRDDLLPNEHFFAERYYSSDTCT